MLLKKIDLKEEYALKCAATLDAYLHEGHADVKQKIRPALIVVPGGAYAYVSGRENEEVALEFFTRDYNVFALNYSVAPSSRYPNQITELACAVDYVKKQAKAHYTDPAHVFAVGFSAGGHLVGSLLNAEALPFLQSLNCRLSGAALCYPVISAKAGHTASFEHLLGNDYAQQKKEHEWLNLDESVTQNNAPAFIWATANDGGVPAVNALLYAAAYAERGLKYELHIFKKGVHGLSLGDERTSNGNPGLVEKDVQNWPNFADNFFRSL